MATNTAPATPTAVPRWALPGELVTEAPQRARRTLRDWAVDTVLFLFAVVWWRWAYDDYVARPDPAYLDLTEGWMVVVDPYLGALLCLALWWRRRYPTVLAVAAVVALVVSSTVTGVVLVALFTVAVHRGWLPATLTTAGAVLMGVWWASFFQPPGLSRSMFTVYMCLMFGVPLGWGLMVRFRRQLLLSLRREAQREREQQDRRLAEARSAERARIAREMHDVLAHRISLLSVHAGALAYRTSQAEAGAGRPLSAAEVGQAVTVIRDSAHRALSELGDVLNVMRGDEPVDEPGRHPPPTLADIPRLVAEARAGGQHVAHTVDQAVAHAPEQEQRTAYRVVQEALTNARKHAPGAEVVVHVTGEPGTGLHISVTNPLPGGVAASDIPGAGAGLTGLAERVSLDGGHLHHEAVAGQFRLRARLPWQV